MMKVMKLALLVALFSAAVGAVNAFSVMTGEDWFPNQNFDTPSNSWEEVAKGIDSGNGGIFDSVFSVIYYVYLVGSVLWGAVKGVLFTYTILEQIFYYDVDGSNAFTPVINIVQLLIYFIYIIGFYQLRHGDSIKHYW